MELFDVTEAQLEEMGKVLCIPCYGDNMGALKFGREHAVGSKLKHLPAALYYAHECEQAGFVSFHQLATMLNIADFWTKAHSAASLDRHRSQWMIRWNYAMRNQSMGEGN